MEKLRPKTGNILAIFFISSMFYSYYVFLIFQKINFLYNKKEYWWVLLVRPFCQNMEKLKSKTGNPVLFFCNSNHMLLNVHFLVVLVHIFFKYKYIQNSR